MTPFYLAIAVALLVTRQVVAMTACQNIGVATRNYTLNVTAGYGSPDGFPRPLLLVNGITPGPVIEAQQGETFVVIVNNMLAVQIGMHWHGLHQRGTPQFDGVPGLNQYAIPPGGHYTYCFGTGSNYGAYWYHVHMRGIYQDGIRGPILIQPNDSIQRPYALIINNTNDIDAMLRAEQSSTLLMVNDWFHETSDAIALRMAATGDSMRPLCADSILFNGMGRVECPVDTLGRNSFGCEEMTGLMGSGSKNVSDTMGSIAASMTDTAYPMDSMLSMRMRRGDQPAMTMSMSMSSRSSPAPGVPSSLMSLGSPSGNISAAVARPSPSLGSALADSCQNTTSSRFVLSLPEDPSWNMVHFINAGASQQLALSLDEHDFWVVSADGAFVTPQKVQVLHIGIGQRYGVMFRKPKGPSKVYTLRASTLAHQMMQGTALVRYSHLNDTGFADKTTSLPWVDSFGNPLNSTVRSLDEKDLAPYPVEGVPTPMREIRLDVNQSDPTVWVLESGQPFVSGNGQDTPLLFAPRNASGVFWVAKGDVVDVLLQVAADSMDVMAHPIHLHGHYFRVLGSMANSTFPTNVSVVDVASNMTESPARMALNVNPTAPRRDSAHLPEGGWLAIRFVADNPGVWLLHCHINSHLASGMAVAFIEAEAEFPVFPDSATSPPTIAPLPVIPEL